MNKKMDRRTDGWMDGWQEGSPVKPKKCFLEERALERGFAGEVGVDECLPHDEAQSRVVW